VVPDKIQEGCKMLVCVSVCAHEKLQSATCPKLKGGLSEEMDEEKQRENN